MTARFAGARRADKGNCFSGLNFKVNVVEYFSPCDILEGNIVITDFTFDCR